MTLRVANGGDQPAAATPMPLFLVPGQNQDPQVPIDDSPEVPALEPGEVVVLTTTVTVPADTPTKELPYWYVTACADATDVLGEPDEQNCFTQAEARVRVDPV